MPMDFQKNYFALFGLPECFDVDLIKLKQDYLALQKTVHPDRYVNATSQEKRLSLQYTALLNEAFSTLRSPVKRAAYLLKLNGVDVDFETNTAMSPEFLMQQMALREKLSQTDDRLALTKEIEVQKQQVIDSLKAVFEINDEPSLLRAKELARQLQFFEKLAV